MITVAALLFSFISLAVCGFQLAMVLGAPWGELTLGGRWKGSLPAIGRVFALLSLALLVFFSLVILVRAGVLNSGSNSFISPLSWIVVGYCAVGVIANLVTPSRRERALWLPVVLAMLLLSTVVAAS